MGEAAVVRVLAVSRIALAPATAADPVVVKLSFFDVRWVVLAPIQRVFLYELAPGGGDGDEFTAAVARLKRSLAATLAVYLPLAGKLAYVAGTGDVVVYCSDDPGVAFVEAEADDAEARRMDVRQLAGDEAHDIPAFCALVPDLPTSVLPAPVLSVQATRLPGGGLALGLSVHHAVVDGQGVWRFMAARRLGVRRPRRLARHQVPPRSALLPRRRPRPKRRRVRPPHAQDVANTVAHDFSHRFSLARRTFYLAGDDILALKRRIDALAAADDDDVADGSTSNNNIRNKKKPVSTFVALASLGWTSFVRAKGLAAGDDTYLLFQADLRARLDPPVGDGYLGNCVRGMLATADAGDLLRSGGGRGLLAACRTIQAAVAEMEAAPLAGTERWHERMMGLPFTRLAIVTASPRFRVYEAGDFGFGKPKHVELVSMNHDGEMVLVGAREDGEVQLSMSLDPARMDEFKAHVFAATAQLSEEAR